MLYSNSTVNVVRFKQSSDALGDTLGSGGGVEEAEGQKAQCGFVQCLRVQSVAEVVRRGRLRWFGHVERKSRVDWVSACRNMVVAGVRCAGKGRKIWKECAKDDMKELGSHPEWVVFRDIWRDLISALIGKNV